MIPQWRIRIESDVRVDGIALQIGKRINDLGQLAQVLYSSPEIEMVEPYTAMPKPSLTIDDDLGRALLDSLAEYYGGIASRRQLRADFEHERRRVDQLIAHLTSRGPQ